MHVRPWCSQIQPTSQYKFSRIFDCLLKSYYIMQVRADLLYRVVLLVGQLTCPAWDRSDMAAKNWRHAHTQKKGHEKKKLHTRFFCFFLFVSPVSNDHPCSPPASLRPLFNFWYFYLVSAVLCFNIYILFLRLPSRSIFYLYLTSLKDSRLFFYFWLCVAGDPQQAKTRWRWRRWRWYFTKVSDTLPAYGTWCGKTALARNRL